MVRSRRNYILGEVLVVILVVVVFEPVGWNYGGGGTAGSGSGAQNTVVVVELNMGRHKN